MERHTIRADAVSQAMSLIAAKINRELLHVQNTEGHGEGHFEHFAVICECGVPLILVQHHGDSQLSFQDRNMVITLNDFREEFACFDHSFMIDKKFWLDHETIKSVALTVSTGYYLDVDGLEQGRDTEDDIPEFYLDLHPASLEKIARDVLRSPDTNVWKLIRKRFWF